uniref:dolichyl pyrophosphate Man9GlcNAc2 alpha-1,3-glucosyltransferase n=1 Tax=Myxine glutinosa TaxID=7769 RepID=UPI00358F6812
MAPPTGNDVLRSVIVSEAPPTGMTRMDKWQGAVFAVFVALAVRWAVSLHPYSGSGRPPMFGDYEAQRHWQEITINLPTTDWYVNSTDNDLQYWGLDYPPLTAYHSLLCATVAQLVDPSWISLYNSRGLEGPMHKVFMRLSVFVADILVYIPAMVWLISGVPSEKPNNQIFNLLCVLLYPGLILIDYGHFQYNAVSLGLAAWAVLAVKNNNNLLGAIFFSLSLNYKQMELYHSLPFFCLLFGRCLRLGKCKGLFLFMMLSLTVTLTFALCWLPFLHTSQDALAVLYRLFPFDRGLYEDKVSNVWCTLSVLVKIRTIMSPQTQLWLSASCTLLSCLPSCVTLIRRPTFRDFMLSLAICSLAFFLFSFQVHEKSILLAALPFCLLLVEMPFASVWFLLVSTFSLLPLMLKDMLFLPYSICSLIFLVMCLGLLGDHKGLVKSQFMITQIAFWLSVALMFVLSASSILISPSTSLPHLWPLVVSAASCCHFLAFLLFLNIQQCWVYLPRHKVD